MMSLSPWRISRTVTATCGERSGEREWESQLTSYWTSSKLIEEPHSDPSWWGGRERERERERKEDGERVLWRKWVGTFDVTSCVSTFLRWNPQLVWNSCSIKGSLQHHISTHASIRGVKPSWQHLIKGAAGKFLKGRISVKRMLALPPTIVTDFFYGIGITFKIERKWKKFGDAKNSSTGGLYYHRR